MLELCVGVRLVTDGIMELQGVDPHLAALFAALPEL